jgi:hypothetical protein
LTGLVLILFISSAAFVMDFFHYRTSSLALESVRHSPRLNSPGFTQEEAVAQAQDSRASIRLSLEAHAALVLIALCCVWVTLRSSLMAPLTAYPNQS